MGDGSSGDGPLEALAGLEALGRLPGVAQAQDNARKACTQLRWHEGLRRRSAEAGAESRVRGAHASAGLEGANVDLASVRDRMRGTLPWPHDPDPVLAVLRGAVQATAEAERLVPLLSTAPLQALARLHVAAAAPLLPAEQLGRPRRTDEVCRELTDLGPPPPARLVGDGLRGVTQLVLAASGSAVVAGAVVHAELSQLRPFVAGNGVVARALDRALLRASGLDPTGVAVAESGHLRQGGTAYRGALAAYGTGSREGVATWIVHWAEAIAYGAEQGQRVADAVLAGRLG